MKVLKSPRKWSRHLSGQTRGHITWSSMHWLIFFLKTRYNLCIWTNRDRENFYNGRGQDSSWTTWNNPKLICTYIWTYCQSSWWHKVGQILKKVKLFNTHIFIFLDISISVDTNNNCSIQVSCTSVIFGNLQWKRAGLVGQGSECKIRGKLW